MKKRNYFLLAAVACVSGLNLFLSINGQNLSSGLKLLTVEAIANAETDGDGKGLLVKHPCGVVSKVIVGYYPDGSPIIQEIAEDGQSGKCDPSALAICSSFECTRVLK